MSESTKTRTEDSSPGNGPSESNDVPNRESIDENMTDECEFVEKVRLLQLIIYGLRRAEPGKEIYSLQSIISPDLQYLRSSCDRIARELLLLFQQLNPIRVELFGSPITGTAFKGSDLDFYISVNYPITHIRKLLHLAKQQLDSTPLFKHFRVLVRPKAPVLKCVHMLTGYKCDLYFNNNIGVYNSRIMGFLIAKDRRIYDVAMITKCWLKAHGFIGHRTMTSYAALWLLFFYFQQVNPPILPPFSMYQSFVPPLFVQSANIAFDYQMYWANKIYNKQLGLHLFKGFFEFYAKFNFESKIICPYLGRALSKKKFIETLADNFPHHHRFFSWNPLEQSKLVKPICIQDPFELCRTIPGHVNERYFYNFRYAIANAAKICCDTKYNYVEKDFLLAMFNTNITIPRHQLYESLNNAQMHRLYFQLKPCPREMQIIREMGRQFANVDHIRSYQLKWAELSIEFLIAMFQEIFRFEITGPGLYNSNQLSKIFFATGEYNVLLNRIKYSKRSKAFLENEIECSQRITQKLKDKLYAEVHIYANVVNFDVIHVDFRNLNTNFFNAFISFRIRDYKLAYFEKHLKDKKGV